MAIITEEPDSPKPLLRERKPKPNSKPTSEPASTPTPTPTPSKSVSTSANPFHFWFYFTLVVSLITLLCVLLSSLSPQDPKTWFLNLPPILRQHYSNGRPIKVQTAPNHPQVEVFSIQQGPTNADSRVLIVHGIGCSSFAFHNVVKFLGRKDVHAVAIDLPGSGFSDKSLVVVEENVGGDGFLARFWEVYEEIKEKGLFWGFDQLVEQGYVNFEENKARVSKQKESIKSIELGSEEMGRVMGQVMDAMGLAPVDLVLHDSALGLSANWISENRGLIRSVIVLDGSPSETALPLWVLGVPVVREAVLGFRFVFERVLAMCCMISVRGPEAEAHRILLKRRDGGNAVVGTGKKLNFSFDLSEWSSLDGIKGLPMQVIWSERWTTVGRQIVDALPQAKLVTHSGGRWMQEHNSEEVAESIYEFVSSLPKPTRQVVEDSMPEHHGHGGHGHHDGHSHGQGHGDHAHAHPHAGHMDAYGLGHGWTM